MTTVADEVLLGSCDWSGVRFRDSSSIKIRSNPRLRFTAFEDLHAEQRAALQPLIDAGDCVGVIQEDRGSGVPGSLKSISQATVDLIRHLNRPMRLDDALSQFDSKHGVAMTEVSRLVLDGVLEASNGGGRYQVGPQALEVLVLEAELPSCGSRLSKLSFDAIEFHAAIASSDSLELSRKLYAFHRLPATPACPERWSCADVVGVVLDRVPLANRALLDRGYAMVEGAQRLGWLAWGARHAAPAPSASVEACKLYISPMPAVVPRALRSVVGHIGGSGATAFKLGLHAQGLTRPDKLVIYFDRFADLHAFHSAISRDLEGTEAHGVPFTCQLGPTGLFSWGMDPRQRGHLAGHSDDSWRMWICNRVGSAIFEALRAGLSARDTVRYTLVKLRLTGIDVESWALASHGWTASLSTEAR